MRHAFPRRLFLDGHARERPLSRRVLEKARELRIPVLEDAPPDRPPGHGDLILKLLRGRWLHPFETLDGRTGEYFLSAVQGCPFRCAYCFVQGYLDHAATVLGANFEDGLGELEAFLGTPEASGARVHAAHLGEWIVWEDWTGWTGELARLFSKHPETTLEIRTKSAPSAPPHPGDLPRNVVLSWTVTPEALSWRFEAGTPGPEHRLLAARFAARRGARVGIRLDPVILLDGWRDAYGGLIELMGRLLSDVPIESVELGTFRCGKDAAERIRRGPHRILTAGELQGGSDGKLRYFWPLRVRAYRALLSGLRRALGPRIPLRLCMEPPWLADRVFAAAP